METKDSEERGRAIVQTLAVVIESMIQPSESVATSYTKRTKFEAFRSPGISIRDYLMRIYKYANCSPECYVLALVYIDRFHELDGLMLTDLNVHRVLITSVVVAAKFFDDHYFNNAYYAKVGGVPCSEMNELEVEFLLSVNFSLHVSTDTYERYFSELSDNPVFKTIRRSRHKFRNCVAMDPEQDGQLIYVDGPEPEEPSEPVYQHQQQQQQQLLAQPVYAYQHQQNQPQSGYGFQQHHPQEASSAFGYQEPHNYKQPTSGVYGYQPQHHQHQEAAYVYQQQQQTTSYYPHTGQHNAPPLHPQYQHQDQPHVHQPRTAEVSSSSHRSGGAAVAAAHVSKFGAVPASATAVSSASNGIVFANSNRKSGQKRSQSVALGVNA